MRYALRPEVVARLKAMSPEKVSVVRRWITPGHEIVRRWCKYPLCRTQHPDRPADLYLKGKEEFCSFDCEHRWTVAHFTPEELNRMIGEELEKQSNVGSSDRESHS